MMYRMGHCTYETGLGTDIVDSGLCCGCGTCAAICPKVGDIRKYNPLMPRHLLGTAEADGDEVCERCLEVCPMRNRALGEGIGPVVSAWRARATDPDILSRCQDGGACTAFLRSLNGMVPLGISSKEGMPLPVMGAPMECMGTKYGATASLSFLSRKTRDVAFVGLPCQLTGIELSQRHGLLDSIKLRIGLFCTRNFHHRELEKTLEREGVDTGDVDKIEIRGKLIVSMKNGERTTFPLSRFDNCVLDGCRTCQDLCCFNGDIAFGSLGSDDGYTTVLIRNEKAQMLFDDAIQRGFIKADDKIDMDLIVRSQEIKRVQNGQAHNDRP
ncbi:MAG TPA: Coenzyme F420 hydrogenase/dehydrogenase, beta subunit C-terminal domain [Candidatus Methanofastidiosa archaeon]|nr:Coenzyme F420 hydrogenase/dehydrogenase, beta subunit C-terminal domain [Candidatus Methanofastidiosa archaeon]